MPEFTFEEATQAPKTFSFEEASAPKSFTFEEAQTVTASPVELKPESARTVPSITATTQGGPQLRTAGDPAAASTLASQIKEGISEAYNLPGLIGPEDVPTGPEISKETGLPLLATIPTSAVAKLGAGIIGYITSPQGAAMTLAAGTPAAPAVFAKWAYDMLKGGVESIVDAKKTIGVMIQDAVANKMVSVNELGPPPQGKPIEEHYQNLAEDAVNTAAMLLGGTHAASKSVALTKALVTPELKATAPQTAAAVVETTKTNEPKSANETKAQPTVSEVAPPAASTEAKVEAPRSADVAHEVGRAERLTELESIPNRTPEQEIEFQNLKQASAAGNSREAFAKLQAAEDAKKQIPPVVTAAVRYKGSEVFTGKFHPEAVEKLLAKHAGAAELPIESGFVDAKGNFLTAEQAAAAAKANKQGRFTMASERKMAEVQAKQPTSVQNAPGGPPPAPGQPTKPIVGESAPVGAVDKPPIPFKEVQRTGIVPEGYILGPGNDYIYQPKKPITPKPLSPIAEKIRQENLRKQALREVQRQKPPTPPPAAKPGDWDVIYESLVDNLDSFSPARETGKRNYELSDMAQRFVDYAKTDTSGKPLIELVKDFAKQDEASASQIKKLRAALKDVESPKPTPAPASDVATGQKPIGMGGAVPAEFEKDFRTGTGIKKAAITAAREERGAEPSEIKANKQPQDEVHERVMKQLDEDPAWPDRLVSELSEKPRALNADEVLVLDTRYVDLQNEYRKAVDEAIQAEKDGRADAVLEGKRKADYWEQKLTDFEVMARSTGTHWGRTGAMMQRTMKADFSLEAMERRARAAKNFEPLTPEEHAKVKAFNEELQAKVKALEERQKAVVDEAVKDALDRVERESKAEQPAYHPRVLKLAERFATYMDKQAGDALARLKAKLKEPGATSVLDPTLIDDLAIIGAAKITRGVVELAKWSDAMVRDVGDWIKPHIAEIRKASDAKFESEATTLDKQHGTVMGERVRKAIKKTESTDAKADITEKITAKVEKGELGDLTPFVNKLARAFLESGIKEREALIDAVHDVLKDIIPDHTRHDTMVAIAGYGRFKRLTKDDISVLHRDLKGQIREIVKLEDMAAGKAPLKSGVEQAIPSDAQRQLIALVNEAKKKGGYEVTNPELELASALSTRLTAIRNRITDLTDEIAKGERNIPERKTPPTSPEIEASKAELSKLREEHAKVFNLALEKLKVGIRKRMVNLETRMANKDFAPKQKRPPPEADPELLKLKGDLESVQEQYQGMLEKWKFDQLNIFGKAKNIAGSTWDAARNIMTTGELSFVLRQGKAFVLSRPLMASRAFVKSLRALASERVARAAELRIRSEPEYADSQTAKLHISREGDKLSRQEELIMGRWGRAIPILKAFNRAAVTFLNELRWESWLAMRKTFSRFGKSTPAEDIQFAKMANEATGRGGLGFAEPAAVVLGRAFFAPRYLVSRIQMAVGHSAWGGTARSRAVIAAEYARILTGYFVYLNLLQTGLNALLPDEKKAKVSFDPRSADFGKIIIGDTRLDIMAGLAQLATFGGRSVTGETKNAAGKVSIIRPKDGKKVPYGGANWYDVAGRFTLSKTHPGISYVGNLLNGVDLIGNEASVATETGKLLGPITYIDIYKALRAQGMEEGAALAVLAFLGEGLQTYQPKKP